MHACCGQPEDRLYCPKDGGKVEKKTLDDAIEKLLKEGKWQANDPSCSYLTAKAAVLREELPGLERRGFQRIRIDGEIKRLDDRNVIPEKTKGREISVDIVIDRLRLDSSSRSRLADSLELAFKEGNERPLALVENEEFDEVKLSQSYSCETCGTNYPNLTPRFFSWNHPDGACETCSGLGEVLRFREDLVIQDPTLSLAEGAIKYPGVLVRGK